MAKALRERPFARARNRRQAYVLLALGVLFLIAAITVHLVLHISPFTYPLGIFLPGRQTLPTFILAIGLALLGIAIMGKRGYVRAGALSPAILVLITGIVEYFLFANQLPSFVVPFLLSLWVPAIGLLLFGLYYLATVGGK